MNETIIHTIASELNVAPRQVEATATLLDDANTIPFIARYRKEVTGSLDEEQLRTHPTSSPGMCHLLPFPIYN